MTRASAVFPGAYASPQALFFCGALLFPPFLMQQDIVVRVGLILFFMLLDVIAGKQLRLLQFGVVSAGIVLFNLIIPTGKVLAAPLGLAITEGALKGGLMKATAMTGLIALSQFSIRPNLRLPGRIGGLIGRSFFYFEAIMSRRSRIDRKDIIGSIDALLLSLKDAGETVAGESNRRSNTDTPMNARGIVYLAFILVFNWAVFTLTLLHPRPFWGG